MSTRSQLTKDLNGKGFFLLCIVFFAIIENSNMNRCAMFTLKQISNLKKGSVRSFACKYFPQNLNKQ